MHCTLPIIMICDLSFLNHSRAGSSVLGSSSTLYRISLPLLIRRNPSLAFSAISGVMALLCLMSVFSTISIISSDPLPTSANKTKTLVSLSSSKYLCNLSSTSFYSTNSQNSLSCNFIIDAPSIK